MLSEPVHRSISEKGLCAGVRDKWSMARRDSHLQTGEVTPCLHLRRQQLHGHLFVLTEGTVQHIHSQLTELPDTQRQDNYTITLTRYYIN